MGLRVVLGMATVVLVPAAIGCGARGTKDPTPLPSEPVKTSSHASRPPHEDEPIRPARLIDSFHARLVNSHVVRLRWELTRPASLSVAVTGVRHGSNHGQTGGVLPVAPSYVDGPKPAARGKGTDRIDFEFGEFNFRAYRHVQFRLRAMHDRTRDASEPVVLTRN